MGKNRDYVVCTSCGDASWQFAYRAWKKPQCKFCGSKWSEWTSKGYRLSDYMTVDNNNWQLWQQGGKKNRSPKAQAVLTEVWEFLPQQAKDMIGFQESAATNCAAWLRGMELLSRQVC